MGSRTGAMSGGFRRLTSLFLESVPDPETQPVSRQRLTRFAQVFLGAGIGVLGVIVYVVAWSIAEETASRLQICPVLGQDRGQVGDLDSFSLNTSGEAPNMLLWNYRLNRELISEQKFATRPQRLLLNQQIASLTIRMSRQCYLIRYYRVQAGALAAVSTGAAVLLVIVGVVRMPRGIGAVTRCEQAILTSSLTFLILSIGYLTLGSQQQQMRLNWNYHKRGLQLFTLIRSSLATNQLLLPKDPTSPLSAEKPIPLDSAPAISELVSRIDLWLLTIDQVSVGLDNSFARRTFDTLFQDSSPDQSPPRPVNPLLNSP
jgi:hypothetical protein